MVHSNVFTDAKIFFEGKRLEISKEKRVGRVINSYDTPYRYTIQYEEKKLVIKSINGGIMAEIILNSDAEILVLTKQEYEWCYQVSIYVVDLEHIDIYCDGFDSKGTLCLKKMMAS